jgi:hypothetical protein
MAFDQGTVLMHNGLGGRFLQSIHFHQGEADAARVAALQSPGLTALRVFLSELRY